jgi:hypothetical protein
MNILQLPCPLVNTPRLNPKLHCSVNCLHDNSTERTTQKTQSLLLKLLYCTIVFQQSRNGLHRKQSLSIVEESLSRAVFTEPLLRNGLHNPVVLLLSACMLRALHSNGRCLQSYLSATGPYTTLFIYQGCGLLLCDAEWSDRWVHVSLGRKRQ